MVVFGRKVANTKVSFVRFVDGKKISCSRSFHSEIKLSVFTKIVEELFLEEKTVQTTPQNALRLIFRHVKGTKKINLYKDLPFQESPSEALKMLLTALEEKGYVYDLKNNRHTIKIFNNESQVLDSKTRSFHSEEPFDVLFEKLKTIVGDLEHAKNEEETIFFCGDKTRKKSSHFITLINGSRTKSFSTNIKNYTSKEILEMIN